MEKRGKGDVKKVKEEWSCDAFERRILEFEN
jgi:hypothetical protein